MEEEYVSVFQFSKNKEVFSRCGYCRSPDTLFKNEMWAYYLTAMDYQHLIDRGWRRCGRYMYKPINQRTCCPMYTIRCDVENFLLSKSQKKVLKIINDLLTKGKLDHDLYKKKNEEWNLFLDNGEGEIPAPFDIKDLIPTNCGANSTPNRPGRRNEEPRTSLSIGVEQKSTESSSCSSTKRACEAPRKKAKTIRHENKVKKLILRGLNPEEAQEKVNNSRSPVQPTALQLEDYIMKADEGINKLRVSLVQTSPVSEEYRKTEKDEFLLYKKYQISVHGDEPEILTVKKFRRFLIESPLEASYPTGGPPSGYGSFHQQYWLNDTLIAVGVIDILPHCVSSVYFFYDPDFKSLSLGTYGSLREIGFVRNLRESVPSLKFYYMGYYIHSCPKMKYKGNFSPSYLLCPEVYTWHPIENCLPKLESSKYSRLEENPNKLDENELTDLGKVVVSFRGAEMRYNTYRACNPDSEDDEIFRYHCRIIGSKCSPHMLYVKI